MPAHDMMGVFGYAVGSVYQEIAPAEDALAWFQLMFYVSIRE